MPNPRLDAIPLPPEDGPSKAPDDPLLDPQVAGAAFRPAHLLLQTERGGRINSTKVQERVAEIQALNPRHRRILRCKLLGLGNAEIADLLDIPAGTVSVVTNSDLFNRQLARLQALADKKAVEMSMDMRERIEQFSRVALSELERILADKTTTARLKAEVAWDALDRAGHGTTQKHEVVHDYATIAKAGYEKRMAQLLPDPTVVEGTIVPPEGTPSV